MLDLSQNPELRTLPRDFAKMENLKSLRIQQCGLESLPAEILYTFDQLQTLDLDKNKFTSFFDSGVEWNRINLPSLTYINLNGNSLTKIPEVLQYLPNLKQLLLHMNKIQSVRPLCRKAFAGLETLDIGGNKIDEIPVAFVYYLRSLGQLTLTNNDIQRLPNMIGKHKSIKNIQVDGNPLKTIRRPIIAKGSQGILAYLHDRYVEGQDDQIEPWALEQ